MHMSKKTPVHAAVSKSYWMIKHTFLNSCSKIYVAGIELCCKKREITSILCLSFQGSIFTRLNIMKRGLCDVSEEPDAKHPATERIKKRKVAMLLSYSGYGYLGMQRNPGTKTIEDELLRALLKTDYISENAFQIPQNIQFQRAARTDKGVSAAHQVVSLKLPAEVDIASINKHLPEEIRVHAIKRTTKGFNSKSNCDARTYSYLIPTFAFAPACEEVGESYRLEPGMMDMVNDVLKLFEGTHNFHNFTSKKQPLDPSANRYIMSFHCDKPFVQDNMEFCSLKVKGQSFMLHQIRKMVGLAVAIIRGTTNKETVHRAWKMERLDLPMAPGLGLVLEEVHYDRYNKRYGSDGIHEPLEWPEVQDNIHSFKIKFIYQRIIKTEIEEKSMLNWLATLPLHSYSNRRNNATESDSEDVEVNSEAHQEQLSDLQNTS